MLASMTAFILTGLAVAALGAGESMSTDSLNAPMVQAGNSIDAGRYLVVIGGCNDCHTANWGETDGAVPEADWLTGVPIGWRGRWGTSYASNLRLLVNDLSEDAWVAMLRARTGLPPMPWTNTKQMSESDSRALYRFIRSLGVRGERMPVAVDVNAEPQTPYLLLEPVNTNQ